MHIQDKVLALVQDLAQRRQIQVPPGATDEEISALSDRLGITMPRDLHDWLHLCNTPRVVRGRILGVASQDQFVDVAAYASRHPAWSSKGWIPIAVDENGNTYVVATGITVGPSNPVLFIDHELDDDTPEYVVASGIWHFLQFLLEREQQVLSIAPAIDNDEEWDKLYDDVVYWPFNKEEVLAKDPEIQNVKGVSMPWEE